MWIGSKRGFMEVLVLAVVLFLAVALLDQVTGTVYKAMALVNLLAWIGAFTYVKRIKSKKS